MSHNITQKKLQYFFLNILQNFYQLPILGTLDVSLGTLRYCKNITNLLFWELWECLTILIKMIVSACSELSCSSAGKKSTSSQCFSRDITRYANLFWVFWECLITHTKMIVLTYRRLRCLSSWQK